MLLDGGRFGKRVLLRRLPAVGRTADYGSFSKLGVLRHRTEPGARGRSSFHVWRGSRSVHLRELIFFCPGQSQSRVSAHLTGDNFLHRFRTEPRELEPGRSECDASMA